MVRAVRIHLFIGGMLLVAATNVFPQTNDTIPSSKPKDILLNEITVVGNRTFYSNPFDKQELDMEGMYKLPTLLGNADVLRMAQLLPGISTNGNLDAGIYIRGGESSHNRVMLDEAPIYNPSHLLGFYSAINADQIGRCIISKNSHAPAYGGRLGGCIDIETKRELTDTTHLKINVGVIATQVSLSHPLSPTAVFYFSGRRTYITPLMKAVDRNNSLNYDFQDYNATCVSLLSPRDRVVFNLYYGDDRLKYNEVDESFLTARMRWSNLASSLSWEHIRRQLTMKHTLFLSNYASNIRIRQLSASALLPSGVMDWGYKMKMERQTAKAKWQWGAEYIHHRIQVQTPVIKGLYGVGGVYHSSLSPHHAEEVSVFVNNQTPVGALLLDAGIRYSLAVNQGNEWQGGVEPRIQLTYPLHENANMQCSYGLHRQYMHQVRLSDIGFPIDFWVAASPNHKAQYGHSFSCSYDTSFKNYKLTIGGYYNLLYNQLERESELFDIFNEDYLPLDHINDGKRWSYGMELSLKMNKPRYSASLSYTLGWAWARFAGLNNGQQFPSNHDRRHDLALVGTYRLSKRWDCSATFVYATGKSYTAPTNLYVVNGCILYDFEAHNNAKLPDYHRLDLSATYHFKRKGRWDKSLNISLHNAYARKNPVLIGYKGKYDEGAGSISLQVQHKAFYSLIPSVSYIIKI